MGTCVALRGMVFRLGSVGLEKDIHLGSGLHSHLADFTRLNY